MLDVRKNVECDYCGATYHIKFAEDLLSPQFCAFCGESFESIEVADEEDDGDLDYTDEERDEERYS
jgi:DNA-directed RNA polymerase subunit RPC12/RpoP